MTRTVESRIRILRRRSGLARVVPWVALAWLGSPSGAAADVSLGLLANARDAGPAEPNDVEVLETLPDTLYGNAVARFSGGSNGSAGAFETQGLGLSTAAPGRPTWTPTCRVPSTGRAAGCASARAPISRPAPRATSQGFARATILDQLSFAGSDVSFDVDFDFDFSSSPPANVGILDFYVGLGGGLLSISANHTTNKVRVRFQGQFLEMDVPIPPSYRHSFTFTPPAGPVNAVVRLDSQVGCIGQLQPCESVADATATAYLGITGEFGSANDYLYLGPFDGSGPGASWKDIALELLLVGAVAAAMERRRVWRCERRGHLGGARVS